MASLLPESQSNSHLAQARLLCWCQPEKPHCVSITGGISQSLTDCQRMAEETPIARAEPCSLQWGLIVHSTACPLLRSHSLCWSWFSLYLPPPTTQLLSPQGPAFLMHTVEALAPVCLYWFSYSPTSLPASGPSYHFTPGSPRLPLACLS